LKRRSLKTRSKARLTIEFLLHFMSRGVACWIALNFP
jgi:hypothetical protein